MRERVSVMARVRVRVRYIYREGEGETYEEAYIVEESEIEANRMGEVEEEDEEWE